MKMSTSESKPFQVSILGRVETTAETTAEPFQIEIEFIQTPVNSFVYLIPCN